MIGRLTSIAIAGVEIPLAPRRRRMYLRLPSPDGAGREWFGVVDRDYLGVVATSRYAILGLVIVDDDGPAIRGGTMRLAGGD